MRDKNVVFLWVLLLILSGAFSQSGKEKTEIKKTSQIFKKYGEYICDNDLNVEFISQSNIVELSLHGICDTNPPEEFEDIGTDKQENVKAFLPGDEFQLNFRLIEIGETITFTLSGVLPGDRFEIFPCYLERCNPKLAEQSPVPLQWLDSLEYESLPTEPVITFIPEATGNYIARWISKRYGVEYRYFAVIDQSYLIYRPAIWGWPRPFPASVAPEIHNGGLPLDWIIEPRSDESFIQRLIDEQKHYGGGIVYGMSDACSDSASGKNILKLRNTIESYRQRGLDVGRTANLWYGGGLSNNKVWTARNAGFDIIDGYVPRADICGMGAPYYPFYIGQVDYRFPDQNGPSDAISVIFDFVGSWHFHGPVGFHRPSARGCWEYARFYLDLAACEAVLTAKNSQMHNFITTLVNYESPVEWGSGRYQIIWDDERGKEFFNNYMNLLAFDHARQWPIVFARAEDYADYFRTHYNEMPRRIVSSITHNLEYDRYWTDEWHEKRICPSGYVPVYQSLSKFRQERIMPQYNMPMSIEFINYNDNKRTCRFEYACPKPLHYYNLTGSVPWPIKPLEMNIPDPDIGISTISKKDSYELIFTLTSDVEFTDYMLAIWDIPREYHGYNPQTNASEFIWISNTDGNCRGIVRFDLLKNCVVSFKWSKYDK